MKAICIFWADSQAASHMRQPEDSNRNTGKAHLRDGNWYAGFSQANSSQEALGVERAPPLTGVGNSLSD